MLKRILAATTVLLFSLVLVIPVLADCGSPGDIVWSEVDYDQPSTDYNEFIELRFYNSGPFTDCELRLLNGSGGTGAVYNTLDLGSVTIPGDGYLVWGNSTVSNVDVTFSTSQNSIQNGDPDGFALVDTSSGSDVLAWLYSYEGTFTYLSTTSTDIGVSENNNSPNLSCNNGPNAGVGDSYNANPTPGVVGPTAITLSSLSAHAAAPWTGIALAGLLLGALVIVRRKR